METIFLFIIFVSIELFESNWQKSTTLYGLLENNFKVFQKNIFLYFVLHTSFLYSIYLALSLNNFGFFLSSIIVLKFLDISFKLSIMKKLSNKEDISQIIPFNANISPVLSYLNVFIYPSCFLLATAL